MIKTATVFRHCRADPAGTVSNVLRERGVSIRQYATPFESLSDLDPLSPDLLVVLGGSCGVYQDDLYPFLKDERNIIKARLDADKPTLGICLGSQLMAAALGARVYKGEQGLENGWRAVRVNDAGRNSPARHFDESLTKVMQWHRDTFTPPPGAVLLAGNDLYAHQAFSVGKNAIALQFHPEVTEDILADWFVSFAADAYTGKVDVEALRRETAQNLPLMKKQTQLFLNEWLDQVGSAG